MKKMISSTLAALLLPSVILAAGDSGAQTIRTIHVEASWFVYLTGASAFNNPDSCGSSAGVVIRKNDPWFREALAAVMLAKASDKQVKFWVSGCETTGWGFSAPIVYSVSVDP